MRRLLLSALVAAFMVSGAMPASANSDVVRELVATYDVQPDGTLDVTWEVDWDFGETGRRGIIVGIVQREPWELDDELDAVYSIDDLEVSSPTGAPVQIRSTSVRSGNVRSLEVRVGDADEPLEASRHTYVLSYTITGALRTFDGVPELFWDVTSADFPSIDQAAVTVTSPGGVPTARCLVGASECESTVVSDGSATYRASNIPSGQTLSVVAELQPGEVSNAEPVLEEAERNTRPGSPLGPFASWSPIATNGLAAAVAAALLTLPSMLFRRRDQRWAAVPPGVMDPGGPVTKSKQEGSIPVRFEPPDATLVEAGLAMDRTYYKSTHLAAVLVQMAVNGALRISTRPLRISQGDPGRIESSVEEGVWQHANRAGAHDIETDKRQFVRMTDAVVKARPSGDRAVLNNAKPSRVASSLPKLAIVGLMFLFMYATSNWGPHVVVPVMFLVIPGLFIGFFVGNLVSAFRSRRTPLTPRGSAILVQTEGFRQYLATAEAAQLNFEAGQDVYRRYLPWAVLFDLTERWARICEDLARMGRIPTPDVSFIAGAHSTSDINRAVGSIHSSTRSAQRSRQAAAIRSSSGGSGGRSGFSSSSRGGGGGGGSRASSW